MLEALELKLIGGLVVAVGLFAGYEYVIHEAKAEGIAQCQATYAAAAIKAETENRAEEQRRATAAQENALETQRLANRARADAAGAAAAAAGLRIAVATRIGQAASDPPAAAGSAPAPGAIDLLTQLLREADERLRGLAQEADARGIAGSSCVSAYESLTK